ncbi:MAG: N-acetylglutaminylglutamine amidotransferase [Methyloceanibacter sp.]|uniref:N-acetylglutaminylglutamine amidotransferase n=1 Tax=Methyloceanibacter sp. TaxID=1965321 RepID=UPI001D9D9CDD|nr:N-acetylglutaminylglutamine amidotransferase [Methyloceanibacter sp.]MCB1442280.1 N-acetylglutaminylglutamine amidotransferase [Methyloceanibacter sp.]
MCGLCGEITFDGSPASVEAIGAMTCSMVPRGPDAGGVVSRGRFAFGHRRLRIIDLSERGQQPMVDPELGLTLVFNGCIYNHKELRAELEAKGYRFFSTSDTEVVLKSWHAWGPEAPVRFNGMFAFVVHERETGRVALARDRLGIKPLYYTQNKTRLRFASTLPALVAAGGVDTALDPVGLAHYMTFHAIVPPPHTILRGVRKLPAATLRIVEPDGRVKDTTYWDLDFARSSEDLALSEREWKDRVGTALRRAVDRRMIADVPVGVLLSGGVDSSLIVGLLAEAGQQHLKTFSIGFEAAHGEAGDEFKYSDIIAQYFGTDHTKIMIPTGNMLDALPGTIAAMSEPMVSYDNVGFYLLSREVAKHVKVVQSGQGADEVFAGYHWYPKLASSNDIVSDYTALFFDRDREKIGRHLNDTWMADEDEPARLVERHLMKDGAGTPLDKALRIDTTVMLVDDPVKRVDNMTMAWGLEARVPFLDHELVELAARVPPELKLKNEGKGVLKDVARDVIPSSVIDRPKGYFPVPALKYIDGPVLEMTQDALTSKAAQDRCLFRSDYLDSLLADPKAHITPLRGSELWQCALLELWLQTHNL